jgi:CRISPR-associated protein Csh2
MGHVSRNSEILYLYDARLCNPNGDPDEENRPRMDYEAGCCLASDVRLKRYLRDYWLELDEEAWKRFGYGRKQDVWVRQVESGETVSAKERIERLAKASGKKSAKEAFKDAAFREHLLGQLVDMRVFGATIPVGAQEGERRGESYAITGPVQFSWGYSLNRAEILPSSTITSTFAGRDEGEKGRHGTIGKDWRIRYALLAFYGVVSAWRARHTGFSETDLTLLDHSMLAALPLLATTRSKIGQAPRLYVRIEYGDDRTFLGDPRALIRLVREEGLESVADVELDSRELVERLTLYKDRIQKVRFWAHQDLRGGADLCQGLEERGITVEKFQPWVEACGDGSPAGV